MAYAQLLKRIENKRARVAVIGMGYVGLPLLQTFCKAGYRCLGFDVDARKIKMLNSGRSYIQHIPSAAIRELRRAEQFTASSDPKDAADPQPHARASVPDAEELGLRWRR